MTSFVRLRSGTGPKWLLVFVLVFLAACAPRPHQGSVLREAQKRGVLRVVMLNSPTTFYEGREGKAGFEYELAAAYAAHLGLSLRMIVVPTIEDTLQAVLDDRADIAAAELTITAPRLALMRFSPPYLEVPARLVCKRNMAPIKGLEDLKGIDIRLAKGASYVTLLKGLQAKGAALTFKEIDGASVETLLAELARKGGFCTVADEHVFALNRRYMPELISPLALGPPQKLAWALGGGNTWRGVSLHRDVSAWFDRPETAKLVARLKENYFSVGDSPFDYVDLARFRRAMRGRLPRYKGLFEKAAKRYHLPWTLLAAVSWRESHWRPDAKSKTGVRGMMMLTRKSAKEAGVLNRLDPGQSINGGARYLARLRHRLPDTITGPDRTWFALAAYNMGYGHVMDARDLAQRRGLDPDRWRTVRALLPELENPAVYKTLPHGYGHGRQAQAYVAHVRNYEDILEKTQIRPAAE